MALTLTIGGSTLTDYLERDGWAIEQGVQDLVKNAEIALLDIDGEIALAARDEIIIEDGENLFHGTVSGYDTEPLIVGNSTARRIIVRGQDDHFELERRIVEYKNYADGLNSDLDIVDDLFATYYASGIDYSTYVTGTALDPAMDALSFDNITLRHALAEMCGLSGGMFYVHYESGSTFFHYFDPATGEANAAAFSLSDDPTNLTAASVVGYLEIRQSVDATMLANAFHISGEIDSDWEEDATSISAYGRSEAAMNDRSLLSASAVDAAGSALLKRYKDPATVYHVTTDAGSGLRAGMQIDLEWTGASINDTFEIRQLRLYSDQNDYRWDLELGDLQPDFASTGRSYLDQLASHDAVIREISGSVFDTTNPAAPTLTGANFATGVVTDADGHQNVYVQMSWGSVGDSDLDHYDAELSAASAFDTFVDSRNHPASGSRIERWTGLVGNTAYYGRVRAVDWTGNYSAWSTGSIISAADSDAPDQVAGLVVAGARTLIGLTWNAASAADLKHYEIQRSTTRTGTYSTTGCVRTTHWIDQNFTESNIQSAADYFYRVRAEDTSGNTGTWSAIGSGALNPLGSDSIAACAIIAGKVAASAIDTYHLNSGTVVSDLIAASAVIASRISVAALSAISACMGTLTAGEARFGSGTVGSNFTGFRLFSSYLAGYNNDVFQAGIRASDGKFVWAGSAGTMDADGIKITLDTAYAADRAYRLTDSAGSTAGYMGGLTGSTLNHLMIKTPSSASKNALIELHAVGWDDSAQEANIDIAAYVGTAHASVELHEDPDDESFVAIQPVLFIDETSNANMTRGITIDQGTADDEAFAIKSSDVAHGATSFTETDTYFYITKAEAGTGGAMINAHLESGATTPVGLYLRGFSATAANTAKTTAARGLVEIAGYQTSGGGLANTAADGNVCVWWTYRGGSYQAIMILDEDGDLHYDGTAGAYDSENDPALIREISDLAAMTPAERRAHLADPAQRARAEALGIVHMDDHAMMVSSKRLAALLRGAILQHEDQLSIVKAELADVGARLAALEASGSRAA